MRARKKRSKLYKRCRKILIIFFLLTAFVVWFFECQAIPFQEKYIKTQAKIISNDAICEAVNTVLDKYNYSYTDLTKITYDSSGDVKSIETDSAKINKLKADINKAVQEKIETVTDADVSVPLGAFTRLSLLNSYGPKLKFDFTFVGSFNSQIESTFESAGYNQTVHHISLTVDASIITLSPEYSEGIEFTTNFEIAQTVIAGELPNTFANIGKIY